MVFVIVGDVNSRTRGIEASEARALVAEGKPILQHDELCGGRLDVPVVLSVPQLTSLASSG